MVSKNIKGGKKLRYAIRFCLYIENEYKWQIEGIYKTKFIANRHMRKLKRKYPNIEFKVKELLGN